MPRPGERFHRITSRSGLSNGRGRSSSAFATLKMEVFAPIPIPRDNTATTANHGFLAKQRRANRISCVQLLIGNAMLAQSRNPSLLVGAKFLTSGKGSVYRKTFSLIALSWEEQPSRILRKSRKF